MNPYNYSKIWITKIIESRFPFRFNNAFLTSLFKLGITPNLIFFIFYLFRHEYITKQFLISYIFVLIWVTLGPYMIWYYDEKLLPNFFFRASDIVPSPKKLKLLAEKYDKLFSQKFWVITLPWIILLLIIWQYSLPTLSAKAGIFGIRDVWYWIGLVGIFWISLLTSIGFWGVLTTLLAIKEISNEQLNIDPLHPDKFGGLSCVGYYAIGTTILFSTGSLFLPAAFQLVAENEILIPYVYLAVFLFSIFILFSFLLPTIVIHQKAKFVRDNILDKLRKDYHTLSQKIKNKHQNLTNEDILTYLHLSYLREEYFAYKNVKLYPFEIEIFAKLISSVVLPFLFLLIQNYWLK